MKSTQLKYFLLTITILMPGAFTATPVQADDDGRYRAVVLQEGGTTGGGSFSPRVFLIDSKEGHMWILERNIPLVSPGRQSFGTVLTYQGKLIPGKQIGEVIYQQDNNP